MNRISCKIILAMLVLSLGVQAQRKSKNDTDAAANASKIRIKAYHSDSLQNTVLTYALQKSIIRMTMVVQKNSFVPGPYSEFAEKLLGAPAKQKAEESYRIKELGVSTSTENDWTQLYSIKADVPVELNQGLVKKYCGDWLLMPAQQWNVAFTVPEIAPTQFLDRGTEATTYDKSGSNSGAPLIPVIAEKSLERRAKDAADYVLLLRKRRTELIGADVEAAYASNEAIKHSLNEMKRLEDLYLSLFYGVTETSRFNSYTFTLDPDAAKDEYLLGYLHAEKGFFPVGVSAGKQALPLQLKITPDTRIGFPSASNPQTLPYRVPMGCGIKVMLGNEVLMTERLQLLQFGPTLYLPASLLLVQ